MAYEYDHDYPFEAFITNLGKYNEGERVGEWVKFPTTSEELQKVFERIGIGSKDDFGNPYEEWFISDYDCYVDGLYEKLGEYENLDELNYMASKLDELDDHDYNHFQAAMQISDYTGSIKDVINLIDNLDKYEIYPGVESNADLGHYYIEELGMMEVPDYLADYIDYEAYGRDVAINEMGQFTDYGYVRDTQESFTEYYDGDRENIPDEYRVMDFMVSGEKERKTMNYETFKQEFAEDIKEKLYSVNNTMLIMMQRPDAQLCQSFTGWKQMGRYVKKGEKGISILAPAPYKIEREQTKLDDKGIPVFDADGEPVKEKVEVTIRAFKVVKTFDLAQTDGKELPMIGPNELVGSIDGYPKLLQALQEISPVPVSFELIDGGAKGYYNLENKSIVIQDGMSEVQTIKTLLHEMAHQKLHDKDTVPEAKDITRNGKEVEAESVAYVVCQHYGINTSDYSFSYVAGWSEGKETPELKASLDKIRQTASEFIYQIDQRMEVLMAEKEQVQGKGANPELQGVVDKMLKDIDKKRTVSKVKESVKTRIKANAEKAEQAPKRNKSAKTKEERA